MVYLIKLKIKEFIFPYGNLDKENRRVKLAAIIPWAKFEQTYAKQFVNNGRPSKHFRIVLGSLVIKQKLNYLNYSDRETVEAISESPYLQYFIGLKEFQSKALFGASTMVEFHKRISDKILLEMNDVILEESNCKKDNKDENENNDTPSNQGTVIIDAVGTLIVNLLNSAKEKLEG